MGTSTESYTKAKTRDSDLQTTLRRVSLRTASSGPGATNPSKSAAKALESRSSAQVDRKKKSTSTITDGWAREKEEKRNRSRFLDGRRRRRDKRESAEERKTREVGEAVSRWYRRGDGPAFMRYTTHEFDGTDGSTSPLTQNKRRTADRKRRG
ncbi:MAG: hypothetical protein Q9188_001519 [Gyalolechia gomerana]